MPWGKQDDAFDEDKRVMRLLVTEGEAGVTAMGLWQLCFTWANRNTRRRGKQPGLLPPMLPMIKMGPRGMVFAALLEKHELWEPVGVDGADGWLIVDFANTLPTQDISSKRAEAGRKGAKKRWDAKRAAEAAAAAAARGDTAPVDGSELSPDGNLLQPDSSLPRSDGNGDIPAGGTGMAPDGNDGLPSVCHAATSGNDGNEPSDDGILLSDAHPNGAVDNAGYGTLLSLDGSLPLGVDTLLPGGSKTAPQSLSQSQALKTKDSPTGVGGVIAMAGSPSTNRRGRAGDRDDYDDEFERFWTAYGKRGKKRSAAIEWHKARTRADAATIMAAVPAYLTSKPDPQYRLYAENWLAEDGWLSDHTPPVHRAASGYGGPVAVPNNDSVYLRNTRLGNRT